MQKVADIEVNFLRKLASAFPRHPLQINQLLASDAEIIDMAKLNFRYLVLKTDGIHEEIKQSLYEDAFLIGWMCVTVTMSDLAAAGADPLGLLLQLQLPRSNTDIWLHEFTKGVNSACTAYKVSILGGDTNFDEAISVNTTGIGTIQDTKPMLRTGMAVGDHLYTTGMLGVGNAFAYTRFFDEGMAVSYQPIARVEESKLIREYASACMDTSDGLFPALSVLASINKVGMRIDIPLEDSLHPDALKVSRLGAIPSWMLLAGPHGEYELLFTVPPARLKNFETACAAKNWQPVYLGEIIPDPDIKFTSEKLKVSCPPALVANLYAESHFDVGGYFNLLKQQHILWSNF